MQASPRISVIIPVYRDWALLDACLDALAAQSWPADDFEVLVVGNDAATPPVITRPGVRVLHQPQGHSYAARNAALAEARGALLAFTDADCRPEPGWLAAGWAALPEDATPGLAGGRIRIAVARRCLASDFDQAFAFRQQQYVSEGHAVTANLFVRRAVIDSIGGFNETMQSGGDFEFCRRARGAGFALSYAAEAVIWHPAREQIGPLFRKNRRVASGFRHLQYDLAGLGLRARLGFVRSMLRPRLRYWLQLLRGQDKTGVLPPSRRPLVVVLHILLHYHFAWSVLRRPPGKDQH